MTEERETKDGTRGEAPDSGAPGPGAQSGGAPGSEPLVVRDKRRIDPTGDKPSTAAGSAGTGDAAGANQPAGAGSAPAAGGADASSKTDGAGTTGAGSTGDAAKPDGGSDPAVTVESVRAELEERTTDLKRVVAEYANYRRRVERDRSVAAEMATKTVLSALLPVLDDVDRAREHGDLVGPFGAVADQLIAGLSKFGLTAFGEQGDPFDPMRHEAVAHSLSADVTEPTCVAVMRRGYLVGEKLLRPAMVAVADPDPDAEPTGTSDGGAEPDGEAAKPGSDQAAGAGTSSDAAGSSTGGKGQTAANAKKASGQESDATSEGSAEARPAADGTEIDQSGSDRPRPRPSPRPRPDAGRSNGDDN